MSDPYRPADPYRATVGQHDTTVLARPTGGQAPPSGSGPAVPPPGWYVPGQQPDPAASQWEARYRRQRTLTAVLGVGVGLALVAMLGLGVAVWQLARSNPLASAVSELAGGDQGGSPLLPEDGLDGLLPDSAEEDPTDATPDSGDRPGTPDAVPLPEPLQELGSAFGITDVDDLVDLAVATGLVSEEDADALRRALAGGAALPELFDGGAEG